MNSGIAELLKRSCTALLLILCFGGAYLHSVLLFTFLMFAFLLIILFFEWPNLVDPQNRLFFAVVTLFYPIIPAASLILLNIKYHAINIILPAYPFIVAFVYDTMGYFVGKLIGKHKMCPTISPGKTWEGFCGSIVGVFLLNVVMLPKIDIHPFPLIAASYFWMLVISIILSGVAFGGGFLISYLKRRKGLKDTGTTLPGHGGFLDRGDSIFVISLVVWLMLLLGCWIR